MSKQNLFTDLVFGLSDKEFSLLQDAATMRLNKERYGATAFNELAVKYKRIPSCHDCRTACLALMTFNVPLEMTEEICGISLLPCCGGKKCSKLQMVPGSSVSARAGLYRRNIYTRQFTAS